MDPKFIHFDLHIVKPDFGSELTDAIINLEHLRKKQLGGTTHPIIFFQLKAVFHLLESLGSARIEGNNTTVAEYIETKIDPTIRRDENIGEIKNMEDAMTFIEENVNNKSPINKALISELHKITVRDLTKEGDKTPGVYRSGPVKIIGSKHLPPEALRVNDYMEELINFINKIDDSKYDLLKTAIAHHRFCWIHPFNNGNGRVVRLLTYALLIKQGFNVKAGRILNPSAVFCNDRKEYYRMLSGADSGDDKGILAWCTYVLKGINEEITKVDKLTDHDFLSERILMPAIQYCLERENITKLESEILKIAVKKIIFQSSDIKSVMPGKVAAERSRTLSKLKTDKLISAEKEGGRKYIIKFSNNYLLRGIINALDKENFISLKD